MILHPRLRALQSDDGPQRAAQGVLQSALASWREQPDVAPVLAALDRFADNTPLDRCPSLAALFGKGDPAGRLFAAGFVSAVAQALGAAPLGHVPLRHAAEGKTSTLVLARCGRAALSLIATSQSALDGRCDRPAVGFGPGEVWEHVLAGRARAEAIECFASGSRSALFERRAIELGPGKIVSLACEKQALRLREIDGCLVSLRLQRRGDEAQVKRHYDLLTGELIHQSAGNPGDSRKEMMMTLLGRMERGDAAPLMARMACGQGSEPLRWLALRECLALDSGEGFVALCAITDSPDDPLAARAAELRHRLQAEHPGIADTPACPA